MSDLVLRFPRAAQSSRIRIAAGGLDRLGAFTRGVTGAGRVVVVSDVRVAALYAPRALASLRRAGIAASASPRSIGCGRRSPRSASDAGTP